MSSPESGEFKNSLEIEKTRRPLWYGLVARIEDGRSKSHFYANAGGPNEAIQLAQQTCPEQQLKGPFDIFVFGQELRERLNRDYGWERQAIQTLLILMPQPISKDSK